MTEVSGGNQEEVGLIRARYPHLPEPLPAWVARWASGSAGPDGADPLPAALTALQAALQRTGRDRDAAAALLAADALLTRVLEDAAVSEAEPEVSLRQALEALNELAAPDTDGL